MVCALRGSLLTSSIKAEAERLPQSLVRGAAHFHYLPSERHSLLSFPPVSSPHFVAKKENTTKEKKKKETSAAATRDNLRK